ncbi:ATP-binding protein [Thiolapillus sp.]|uniref:sensor histidine kinase n=1 Tax=Thiolapillus sp. TaxID=2017437 RepID=UPI003AF640AB
MTEPSCKLLLIDTSPSDAELADKLLSQAFPNCELTVVSDAVAFAEQLANGGFSAVISEQALGWASGMDVLATFSRRHPLTATILFSETLPPEACRLEHGNRLFACLTKNSAGFLQLADIVASLLRAIREDQDVYGFWRQTLGNMNDPALTVTADGQVEEANNAAAGVLGYQDAAELRGLGLEPLFNLDAGRLPKAGLKKQLQAMAKGAADPLNIQATPLKGASAAARGRLTVWPLPGDAALLAAIYRPQAGKQAPADPDGEYQQLLYAVSHDLQEPLQLVSRYADLLQEDYGAALEKDGRFIVRNLASNARLTQSMLDDLLEYSRLGRLEPILVEVDLNEIVDDVTALYAHKLQELNGKIKKADLPTVMADWGQMVRLFQNLIGNAIKFHGRKKLVVSITAAYKDGYWEVMVEDNGIGIDREQYRNVFTMFKRLHTEENIPGNGMGLAFCERIVTAHGGRIWVSAREGEKEGVIIHFSLPADTLVSAGKRHVQKGEVIHE